LPLAERRGSASPWNNELPRLRRRFPLLADRLDKESKRYTHASMDRRRSRKASTGRDGEA
jgi:hypothetical protein